MENFNLKKFLVENKLTKNSRILTEIEQSVNIANNLKKIKVDAEAVIATAKRGIEDQEKWSGITRDSNIDIQAVEQQIEVVEDTLEKIEDYAGDGWAVDIEDVAREKSIPELQMMLKDLVEETDELNKVYTGKPLQEEDLNEGWKNWALGAISALSVLGGASYIQQHDQEVAKVNADRQEYYENTFAQTINKMSNKQLEALGLEIAEKTGTYVTVRDSDTPKDIEAYYARFATNYVMSKPYEFTVNPKDGLIHWKKETQSPYRQGETIEDAKDDMSWNKKRY